MTITAFSGPIIGFGQNPVGSEYNPDLGPSLFWGGAGLMDPRLAYAYQPGRARSTGTYGWLGFDNITTISAVPYTKAAGAIVASANPASATLTLVSANSATTGVYITPSITRGFHICPGAASPPGARSERSGRRRHRDRCRQISTRCRRACRWWWCSRGSG